MGMPVRQAIAAVTIAALCGGCFGYNPSAKRWAYLGNAVLVAGGGAAIAGDEATKPPPCTGTGCPYRPKLEGPELLGAMLVTAGVIGIVINATRANVKASR